MNADPILLQKKYARIIQVFADKEKLSYSEALDIFYNSLLYKEVSRGVADLHCRSDQYLADELSREYHNID